MADMQVVLASPRGFCAGVVRAIRCVELALEVHDPPVYVLHEIVHNQWVVKDLERRGAIFVERLEQIPSGAVTVFSAHGVPTAVADAAARRGLSVIDATCPLVTKVHLEVAAHSRAGRELILIGHAGHQEVIGTLGRYDRQHGGDIYLVETVDDAKQLVVHDPRHLAVVTQTTLSVDDTRAILSVLRRRFPALIEPHKDDICYATQNRQSAVRRLLGRVDMLIVVGARNSSNSNRLRELGEQLGLPSYLVQDADEVDSAWLLPGRRVGITAGASTPDVLVQQILARLGQAQLPGVVEMDSEPETTMFRLPSALVHTTRVVT